MTKIGLATPYRVANYGTKLQAYALQTYLGDVRGMDVEIISYNPSEDHSPISVLRKVFSPARLAGRIRKIRQPKKAAAPVDAEKAAVRKKAINRFDTRFGFSRPVGKFSGLRELSQSYRLVFAGSDQIWVPRNIGDKYFTLEFCADGVVRASYAASLGVESLSPSEKKKYARFLKRLDHISVREENGKELLQTVVPEKTVEWVCDPTLLLSADRYAAIEAAPEELKSIEGEYIFCYFLGTNSEHRKAVHEYARKNNLKILTVANFRGYCEEDTTLSDVQLYNLGVEGFLYLIHHARLVCTDSMHATIFSNIFETDFWTFERFKKEDKDSRNSRIYSLLKVMGLEDRLIADQPLPDRRIDFKAVRGKREAYIRFSENFIERTLENVH